MLETSGDEIVDLIFAKDGVLDHVLDEYEERHSQKEMVSSVFRSYREGTPAIIEAGTGTGKSFAYMVPAIFWALKHQEKTIISTHTIALQEQLIKKDIPFLSEILDIEVKAVLVKGMENYLCLKRYEDAKHRDGFLADDKLDEWVFLTTEGSRSSYKKGIPDAKWAEIKADRDVCTHVKCPHYKECFFFKARKEVQSAQIVVVNHHLFLADKEAKSKGEITEENSILPTTHRVIIDEAHHLEEITSQIFSSRIDQIALYNLLNKIHLEKGGDTQILHELFQETEKSTSTKLTEKEVHHLQLALKSGIPKQKEVVATELTKAFQYLDAFCESLAQDHYGEQKWRLDLKWYDDELWNENVRQQFISVRREIKSLVAELEILLEKLAKIDKESFEIEAIIKQLKEYDRALVTFFDPGENKHLVRWIEKRESLTGTRFILVNRYLDVASVLEENVFDVHPTVVMCSATLSTNDNFNFLKSRIGLEEHDALIERIYPSPFNYEEQALFGVPSDISPPTAPSFNDDVCRWIVDAATASNGGVFILFTSYAMMNRCYDEVETTLWNKGFTLFKQGDAPRQQLLTEYKKEKKAILFGTDSFWEGVDVSGDALRLVMIVKIPFKVPSDPVVQAHSERLLEEGKDPFFHYSVPHAVVKFKQGFGRLIRNSEDRGCVICLDHRIYSRGYGKQFLDSLPEAKKIHAPKETLLKEMRKIYRKKSGA